MKTLAKITTLLIVFIYNFSFGIHLYHQQTGNFVTIQTTDTTFISALKKEASKELAINSSDIQLIYKGTTLSDVYTLNYYDITSNDTIFLNYTKQTGNINYFKVKNASFNTGYVYDSVSVNEDGTGTLYVELTFFAIKNPTTALGIVQIIENSSQNRVNSTVFLEIATANDWVFNTEKNRFSAIKTIPLTTIQLLALSNENRSFQFQVLDFENNIIAETTPTITNTIVSDTSSIFVGTSAGTLHILGNSQAIVTIYDVLGRSLMQTTIQNSSAINTNGLIGTYIVVIESATETIKEKVILE